MKLFNVHQWLLISLLTCFGQFAYSAAPNIDHTVSRAWLTQQANSCNSQLTEAQVQHGPYHLFVREYQGTEPPIVLMHGFPDNTHLYDRLVPNLCGRHLVLFDFLGWGSSDKPQGYSYTFADQKDQLTQVIAQLALRQPLLVAHDASGPAAINWALDHQRQTGGLVLLNTFYHLTPSLSAPEAIAIFADLLQLRTGPKPQWTFSRLSQAIADDPRMFRWMYYWQVGGFFRDDTVRRYFLPKLYAQFAATPSSVGPFVSLNHDLGVSIGANTQRTAELSSFGAPVRIIFGADDLSLNTGMAQELHEAFPSSDLFLLPNAGHFVQMDEPQQVADLILTTPTH